LCLSKINKSPLKENILKILETVTDPELPVLSVIDLGIVRDISIKNQEIEVFITPTYSGCPAMNVIEMNIKIALHIAGFENIKVTTILSPAWTTDWMSESGKQKLKAYGIAPPQNKARLNKILFETHPSVFCPLCDSENTEMLAEFGSTSCKSLYRCKDCLEPFDYFKCH
jgi:ring-1,2-phenylacetyl-CoA epoxidase subunit PaaD